MTTALLLLLALAPLVVFYGVEARYGPTAGIALAMAFVLGSVAWTRWRSGRWSRLALGVAALVLGLGGLSLLSDDPRFYLYSPVVGDVVFAAVLAGSVALGRGVLSAAAREQDPTFTAGGPDARYLDRLSIRLALNFLAHAALTAWATTQPRETWLLVSGPGQYAMLGAQMAAEFAWATYGPGERESDEDAPSP